MKVKAKCLIPAWDYPILYRPGQGPLPEGLYEIDSEGPLARIEPRPGVFAFEFDREAAISSGEPTPSPVVELTLPSAGEATPSSEVQTAPAIKVDRRGLGPRTCKPCGQKFDNLSLLMKHKRDCPEKAAVESERVTQAATV